MKRRGVLLAGGSAAGVALAAAARWPGWLREAFAGAPGPGSLAPDLAPGPAGLSLSSVPTLPARLSLPSMPALPARRQDAPTRASHGFTSTNEALGAGHAQAVAERKKLLVLVIPASEYGAARHERGQAFGEFLNHGTDAALAPLASAVVVCARMDDLAAAFGASLAGEPLMVLVDLAQRPASLQALDDALPAGEGGAGRDTEDRVIQARIEVIAELVRLGLGLPGVAEIEARAARVRQRIVRDQPPGARWAIERACVGDCGMGHTPERSARFLSFLVNKAP